jgi:hypothetical protein
LFASLSVAVNDCIPPTGSVAEDGLTVTDETGIGVTVMDAVPLLPSLVAVIVTGPPAETAVTMPVLASTLATAALLELHVTERPVSTLSLASFAVAVSCCVAPATILAEGGLTVTLETGTNVTLTTDVPIFPSLVAEIVAVPVETAVTSPFASTVAAELSDVQVKVRPVRAAPLASLATAVSCCVFPITTLAEAGLTVTVATETAVTVIEELPLWPSLVAVIDALPAAIAVTRPFASTVAAAVLFEDHVTVRPLRTLLLASFVVTVNCCVAPAATLAEAGVTVTVATGDATVERDPPSQSSIETVLPYTPTPGEPPGSDESVMLPIATPFL